ncbi:P-loop containing nucleoside triphosphate hydrolase protein [Rhodofomes roseus]|uniref:P-loop containing nucleoside triphosphate hydrolase protein n=1 Tax=Rhodofomes roseus TaxID=34475 RepID=A0ABQ8KGQ9_9APHY|nr:P-loop containing nucleoside triphosphate hydrolase protein [Rhodofomes roseus]KAH9836523.1 P-loop containing nucleoside triphosphate hydrolase protein [Rhodofomes roseus]
MAGFPLPQEIFSVIASYLSFSALSDWIKLFVVGGALETCRRYLFTWWDSFLETFWLVATIDQNQDQDAYRWVLYWLSHQKFWNAARVVDVSTSEQFGLEATEEDEDEETSSSRKLTYLPDLSKSYKMWYKGRYMVVTRESRWSTMQLSIFSRDRAVLHNFMEDARQLYKAAEKKCVSIYAADTGGFWNFMTARPKRPLTSIIMDPGVKERLLNDARNFLASRKWYSDRGIPYRRGYLLYGAPGSGKTSVIHSIAGELGLDVYIVTVSRAGMDDTALTELISNMPRRCIALMEDIDAAFKRGVTRELLPESGSMSPRGGEQKKDGDDDDKGPKPVEEAASRVTLSGLLNALDGIGAQEGRILFATTNNYKALDPALCRPGRMDLHVEFRLASRYQAENLYKSFFTEEDKPQGETSSDDVASEKLLGSVPPSPPATPPPASPDLLASPAPDARQPNPSDSFSIPVTLSKREGCELAARFANIIPERQFSMAGLQGYLMLYKSDPRAAVVDAPAWVKEEMARMGTQGGRLAEAPLTSGVVRLD